MKKHAEIRKKKHHSCYDEVGTVSSVACISEEECDSRIE
jgi:hypothetical protein